MTQRKPFKWKGLLLGFVAAKMLVTGLYAAAVWMPDVFLTQQTAIAQDVVSAQDKGSGQTEEAAKTDAGEGAFQEQQTIEVTALLEQLEAKRLRLKDEEERIKQERAQLEKLKLDIDIKLDELAAVQAKIDASLAQKAQLEAQARQTQDEAGATKLKQLVKVYTSMSPKKAAEIIDKLDMDVVYEVFSNMKGEEVGQILTYVDGERAAAITERLASDRVK